MAFGVVIPVFNEPRLALLLQKFDFEATPHVVIVDDGSFDGSTSVAGGYPVTVLKHDKRIGVGAALQTGLKYLKERGFAVAVIMAGNNKDDPREIPLLISKIQDGADYVQGSRYAAAGKSKGTPFVRRMLTRAVAQLWSLRFWRTMTDVTNGFRAYKLAILDHPEIDISQDWLNRYELEYYLHYKVHSLGYRCSEVLVSKHYPRDTLPTSKIKLSRDFWSLFRPFVLLTLRLRK